MKILYVVSDEHLDEVVIDQLRQLHLELIERNHSVTLLCPIAALRAVRHAYVRCPEVDIKGLSAKLPRDKFSTISRLRSIRKTLASGKFNVVSIDGALLSEMIIAIAGYKIPIVVNLHCGFLFNWKTRFLLRLKKIKRITVGSEDERDYAMERGGLEGHRVDVAYDGFFEAQPLRVHSQLRRSVVGIPNGAFIIGVGCDNKDLCHLEATITVFDHVSAAYTQAYLVLVGISRADLRARNISLTAQQLLRVRFINGFGLNSGDFSLFDLFLAITRPSRGIPWLLKEVVGHGTPALAFDSPGNREIINHLRTGFLVAENDIDEIYKMISFAIQEPEKIGSMANNAQLMVSRKMSHVVRAQRLIEIYFKAISQNTLADAAHSNP